MAPGAVSPQTLQAPAATLPSQGGTPGQLYPRCSQFLQSQPAKSSPPSPGDVVAQGILVEPAWWVGAKFIQKKLVQTCKPVLCWGGQGAVAAGRAPTLGSRHPSGIMWDHASNDKR